MHSRLSPIVGVALLVALPASMSLADRIALRDGGRIKGKVVDDPAHQDRVLVIQQTGKSPPSFLKKQIIRVEPVKSVLDEYVPKRLALSKTVANAPAEHDLGVWCEEKKLADLATYHFENAVKIDPKHAPSRLKLGFVEHEGKWLGKDELKIAQGFVLYKGRWITKEEKQRLESETASTLDNATRLRRLSSLKQVYATGNEQKRAEVLDKLQDFASPDAIPAILKVFATDQTPAFRAIAARVLGRIHGQEASKALVTRLLFEEDEETRAVFGEQLKGRPTEEVMSHLAQGLRARGSRPVNNAGWALGLLNATSSVPKLIPALTSVESRVVWVQTGGRAMNPGPYGMNPPAAGPAIGIGGGGSLPVLTGPVVGQGVVAFGATSVPYSNIPVPVGPTVPMGPIANMSVRTSPGSLGPIPQTVYSTRRNPEVLAALVKLTGKDFGFDLNTWKRWLRTEFRSESETSPSKTVPQP